MSGAGPDSAASWAIAVSCCFINTMLFGMTRLNGVLFVASVPRYGVGREEASFPYTFANFMRNTSGPLVGYLGHKLGVRPVTTFGCLLAAIGVGTCFLAESVGTMIVLWGTLYGLGFGLGSILLPVKLNQYFDKHRATASGISYSGACLGSFVLPSIVEVLVNTYGLSGTFLILSGLVLNCVPAALLLRKPNFTIKSPNQKCLQDVEEERQSITSGRKVKLYTVENGSDPQVKDISEPLYRKFDNSCEKGNIPLIYNQRIKCPSTQTLLSKDAFRVSNPDLMECGSIVNKQRLQMDKAFPDCEINSVASYKSDQDSEFSKDYDFLREERNDKTALNPFIWKSSSDSSVPLSCNSTVPQCPKNYSTLVKYENQYVHNGYEPNIEVDSRNTKKPRTPESSSTSSIFSVVCDPIFVLIALTNALYGFTFVCMMTVIVDFARDVGVATPPRQQGQSSSAENRL